MAKKQEIHWALLSDRRLHEFGAMASVRDVSRAIETFVTSWGGRGTDGLVICHPTVLERMDPDGHVRRASQHVHRRETAFRLGLGAGQASIVDRFV